MNIINGKLSTPNQAKPGNYGNTPSSWKMPMSKLCVLLLYFCESFF